jgi:hypothetical protein
MLIVLHIAGTVAFESFSVTVLTPQVFTHLGSP